MIVNRPSNMGSAGAPNAQVGSVQGVEDGTPLPTSIVSTEVDQSTDTSLKQLVDVMGDISLKLEIIIGMLKS